MSHSFQELQQRMSDIDINFLFRTIYTIGGNMVEVQSGKRVRYMKDQILLSLLPSCPPGTPNIELPILSAIGESKKIIVVKWVTIIVSLHPESLNRDLCVLCIHTARFLLYILTDTHTHTKPDKWLPVIWNSWIWLKFVDYVMTSLRHVRHFQLLLLWSCLQPTIVVAGAICFCW